MRDVCRCEHHRGTCPHTPLSRHPHPPPAPHTVPHTPLGRGGMRGGRGRGWVGWAGGYHTPRTRTETLDEITITSNNVN
jgi:hypothetical protein